MKINSIKDTRLMTGRIGEQAAERYLLLNGFQVIERNWRCKIGEIDLIAGQGDQIVFVEVRTRHQGGSYGTAVESVDDRKQRKVRRTAEVYIRGKQLQDSSVRFDLITVELNSSDQAVKLDHYRHAF